MNQLKFTLRLGLPIGFMGALLLVAKGIGLNDVTQDNQTRKSGSLQHTGPHTLPSKIQYPQLRSQLTLSLGQLQATDKQTAVSRKIGVVDTARASQPWDQYHLAQRASDDFAVVASKVQWLAIGLRVYPSV